MLQKQFSTLIWSKNYLSYCIFSAGVSTDVNWMGDFPDNYGGSVHNVYAKCSARDRTNPTAAEWRRKLSNVEDKGTPCAHSTIGSGKIYL